MDEVEVRSVDGTKRLSWALSPRKRWGGTTPRGVGTHPPTTGKTAVRPTATAKYPATAAMAVWSVVSVGSSMVPPARRPEVVTHALFGKFSRAHFSSVPRFG